MIKLLAILFSISFRTPYQQPNPTDFEIMAGLKNQKGQFQYIYERENGKYYTGSLLEQDFKYLNLKYYRKDAVNIENGSLIVKYPYKKIEAGISLLRDFTTKQDKVLLYSKFKNKFLNVSYQNDLKGYSIFEIEISDWKYEYVKPLIVYKNYDGKKFWQVKFLMEVKL